MVHARRRARVALSFIVALACVALVAPPALAEAPANDKLRHAIEISSIPYTNQQSTVGAESDGPRFCSNNGSVFYTYTATETRRLQADTLGSDYDTVLGVFTGGRFDAVQVACNDDRFGLDSGVRFRAEAGETYSFIIGYCCGDGGDDVDQNGNLVFTLDRARKEAELSVEVTVDEDTTLNGDGSLTVTGTVTCTARSNTQIDGAVRQSQGDVSVRGGLFASVGCDDSSPVPWEGVVVPRSDGTFVAGDARIRYSFFAASWNTSLLIRDRVALVSVTEA
jgi:hypothetical protein